MSVVDVGLVEESQLRYLTYALSVVNNRALPDVRDGLKPVQRRILYAMAKNLHLSPDKHHRKSAAVVGEVLARFHPHGDVACYEAMVRMAQDFSLRYPLVDGQGNFGSLDGDSPAAYRYTEVKLTPLALEVLGEIDEQTVSERDNFDQTTHEPVVLPTRVPNLLMNGASGIAVGMATSIPPHNLVEVVKALLLLLVEPETSVKKLQTVLKGPDFPTGCMIVNTKEELENIYRSGRGSIRMRGSYRTEKGSRGKEFVIIDSIPYAIEKSGLVERIADLIIQRKVPQLTDIRDESTDEVRIVLEIAPGSDVDLVMTYLYKNTPLESPFHVNMTALVPTGNPFSGKPVQLSLREMLQHFLDFRLEVTRKKLEFEKGKLLSRMHLLQGLMIIIDVIPEVIAIVRKSDGRQDAASKLRARWKLSEDQAFFIVDLRIYQLSKTSIDEVSNEFKEKEKRVKTIEGILKSEEKLKGEISADLARVADVYGDARRSKILTDVEEREYDEESFVTHEECWVLVTKDGWVKRIRRGNDPSNSRTREGDELRWVIPLNTKDQLAIFTSHGSVFVMRVADVVSTSGFGDPVQKLFKFQDGESVVAVMQPPTSGELLFATIQGQGGRLPVSVVTETKRSGKRVVKLNDGDRLLSILPRAGELIVGVTAQGYVLCFHHSELPLLSGAGKGVIVQKLPKEDELRAVFSVSKKAAVKVATAKGEKELSVSSLSIASRAQRGLKEVSRNLPVLGVLVAPITEQVAIVEAQDSGGEKVQQMSLNMRERK